MQSRLKIERQCSSFQIVDSYFDVYDINLLPNRLLTKSIQILTKASRFLTARKRSVAYLSNMNAPHLQIQYVAESNPPHTIFRPERKPILRRDISLRPYAVLVCVALLLCLIAPVALAQQQSAGPEMSSSSLPDAPLPQSYQANATEQSASAEATSSVSGVVLDASGAAITGARISLAHADGTPAQTITSESDGRFTFTAVPAGSYLITVTINGFESFTSSKIWVTLQQPYVVPTISLSVASTNTEITVRPTDVVAAEQLKAQEKQRLLGVVPNFEVSYVWDAAPLTKKQKFTLASHGVFDPVTFVGAGIAAGIEQGNKTYPGYGLGAAGYGKRFAASYGDQLTDAILGQAVFPSLFHQDPRYFYQGTGTVKSRLVHAISYAVIVRSDSGHPMLNYSYFLGDVGSGALSNLYYPHADRGVGLVFTNAAISIGGRAAGGIVREFLSKHLSTNVPDDVRP